jgi:hypothetical protein
MKSKPGDKLSLQLSFIHSRHLQDQVCDATFVHLGCPRGGLVSDLPVPDVASHCRYWHALAYCGYVRKTVSSSPSSCARVGSGRARTPAQRDELFKQTS